MNKVILMGRLTRDPNVRYSPRNNSQEEMAIARYTLAVDRRGAKDGQQSAGKKAAGQQDGNNGGYSDAGDGFMNIPDGIDEELPFN